MIGMDVKIDTQINGTEERVENKPIYTYIVNDLSTEVPRQFNREKNIFSTTIHTQKKKKKEP